MTTQRPRSRPDLTSLCELPLLPRRDNERRWHNACSCFYLHSNAAATCWSPSGTCEVNYPIALGTRETKAGFSPDETLPLTVIIDREGTIRGAIAGILLPAEFDQQIKPLLQRRASERETIHVPKNK